MRLLHGIARIALFLLLFCPAMAMAQTHDDLLNRRVRIYAVGNEGPMIGVVEIIADEGIQLRDRYGGRLLVPLSAVERLQMSQGRSYVLSGLGGVAAGFAAGAIVAGFFSYENEVERGLAGGGTALIGMLVGAGIGLSLAPERWSTVPLSGTPAASVPGSGLVIVSVSLVH